MKQPKIVLLIFVSGKIVLTGAKVSSHFLYMLNIPPFSSFFPSFIICLQVREETYTAFENIYPVLTEFRKVQQWYVVPFSMLTSVPGRRLLLKLSFSCSVYKFL